MKKKVKRAILPVFAAAFIFAAGGVTTLAAGSGWSLEDAFSHVLQSNGRIEYDYEGDGDLTGPNDVVIDTDDIKALEKRSEVTLYGDFVADLDTYGDSVGTGTLYIRIGENPDRGN